MKRIAILGGGPSQYKCPDALEDGEIWGINSLGVSYETIKIDRMFLLHDVLTEVLIQDHSIIGKLNAMDVPVYTAGPAPIFDNNIPFPINDVVKEFGVGFFLNTMAYMIALAIMQKPKEIYLYGVDMRPDSGYEWHKQEKGCLEFWVGVAIGRGILVYLQPESFLLKRTMVSNWYAFQPIKTTEGALQFVQRSDRGKYKQYIIAPCDDKGKAIGSAVIITPNGPKTTGEELDSSKDGERFYDNIMNTPKGDGSETVK